MPHKRKSKRAAPPPQAPSSRRFSFDWFSDMEDHLAEALARADASSAVAGGLTSSPLPTPLLETLPLPSAVLGPEFARLDQAFATVDPRFLNFDSDDDMMQGEVVADLPHPLPPPAPYTDRAPGASLWNPDMPVVTIDTMHPQDRPFIVDVLSLSCILAQRTRDIAHRHADNTHDTFVTEPFRLDENFSMAVPPPSPGTVARTVFLAQPPHVVASEVRVVEHMLLTAGHWLATVDVPSVPLHEQQGLFALAASAFAIANQCFPDALPHEQTCPLFQEAVSSLSPPPVEGESASHIGSPTASGSALNGPPSPPQTRRPRKRRPAKR